MKTGWLSHELYLWHNTWNWAQIFPPGLTVQPGTHAENPETKRRFRNLLEVSGIAEELQNIKPVAATVDDIARFHTREYIDRIKRLSEGSGGDASYLSPFGTGSFEIALLSAGGLMTAFDAVLQGHVKNAYSLVRPPGHHATSDEGLGFCIFGNVAVAIKHAQDVHQIGRIATVDWDVHHGNGTQSAFYNESEVLTISLHQDNLFPPDSGSFDENGEGDGEGYCLNVPLPPGCADDAYIDAFERVVIPALDRFKPEMIVVSSGFDASGVDPLGRMMLTSEAYRKMTGMLMASADQHCDGRLLMSHEGGYSETHVPYCGLAVLEELSGCRSHIDDPWLPLMSNWGQTELQPHQVMAIDRGAALVGRIK